MKDGGQAFPVSFSNPDDIREINCLEGMTLRDYFAGQALVALYKENGGYGYSTIKSGMFPITISERCYELSDAMIAEKEKEKK